MHYYVESPAEFFAAYITIVYAKNTAAKRVSMWTGLVGLSTSIQEPWILSGDFNTLLSSDDRLGLPCYLC